MSGYIGINGKARNITNGYIGINGKARNIIKCYIGDENGKAKLLLDFNVSDVWDGTTLKTINGSNVSNSNINSISFVKNYTPSGSENSTWDATSQNNNKIIGYIVNNKDIIIVYKDKIYLSENSPIKFSGYGKLSSLDLSSFNTSNVTYMGDMFHGCSNLTELNLSNFDTSKVSNMSNMFYKCINLTSLDLSSFNTSNVTNMYYMFQGCSGLTSLNLSSFNTSKVTNMNSMFQDCSNLTELNLSNFDTSKVSNINYIFGNCSKLNKIILNNTTPPPIDKILGQIPRSAKIYVPAESVETYKTNWSKYASRILAIE